MILTIEQQKKRGRRLDIPISKALKRTIDERLEVQKEGFVFAKKNQRPDARVKNPDEPWPPTHVSHQFKFYASKAGLPKQYRLHSLRHTYATHLRSKAIPLDIVQKLLGHTSPLVTSQSYDHSVALHFRDQADLVDFEEG